MSSLGGSFRMATTAEILYRSYGLPVIVEALQADMTAIARIVVKSVEGICDIEPMYPLDLTEEPHWVRFTPKDQGAITIKFSKLAVFEKS
jgi:hypothetical protein